MPPISSFRNYNASQYLFLADTVLSNAAICLSTGPFLSGYIVILGGSDFLTGFLSGCITWSNIAALFSIFILDRLRRKKNLFLILNAISRSLICSVILLPLIFNNQTVILHITVAMTTVGTLLYGFYNSGMIVWMIDLLPSEKRIHYIYIRTFWLRISFILPNIAMGLVLDLFHKNYSGFLVVFLTSLLLSALDIIVLCRIDEPKCQPPKRLTLVVSEFFEPFTNQSYRVYLIFLGLFYISLTMSTSFTMLYAIRYLRYDYSLITLATVLSYIMMIGCAKFWKKIQDKKGLLFVLRITAILVACENLVNSFLQNDMPSKGELFSISL